MKKVTFITVVLATMMLSTAAMAIVRAGPLNVRVYRNGYFQTSACSGASIYSSASSAQHETCTVSRSLPYTPIDATMATMETFSGTLDYNNWSFWKPSNNGNWDSTCDSEGFMYYSSGYRYYHGFEDDEFENENFWDEHIYRAKFKFSGQTTEHRFYFDYPVPIVVE